MNAYSKHRQILPCCNLHNKDISHSLFGCSFSVNVWKQSCLLSGISNQFWDDEVNWLIRKLRGKSFPSVIRRLAWAAIIFYVWHERFVESSKVSKDLLILIFRKAKLMWGLRALSSLMLSHVLLSLPYVILGKLVLVFHSSPLCF